MTDLEKIVREEVEKVVDPETGLTFGQMKMITDVKEQKTGVVKVDFVPSSARAQLRSSSPSHARALPLRQATHRIE